MADRLREEVRDRLRRVKHIGNRAYDAATAMSLDVRRAACNEAIPSHIPYPIPPTHRPGLRNRLRSGNRLRSAASPTKWSVYQASAKTNMGCGLSFRRALHPYSPCQPL